VSGETPGQPATLRNSVLLTVLDGLVACAVIEVSRWSPHRRSQEAQQLAGIIGVASELFNGADAPTAREVETMLPPHLSAMDERARSYRQREILAALARGIALGIGQPGGVTFAGRHWCGAPHEGCTSGNVPAPAAVA
jgi:hypothetical protein